MNRLAEYQSKWVSVLAAFHMQIKARAHGVKIFISVNYEPFKCGRNALM